VILIALLHHVENDMLTNIFYSDIQLYTFNILQSKNSNGEVILNHLLNLIYYEIWFIPTNDFSLFLAVFP
jgi:hypothetical protein